MNYEIHKSTYSGGVAYRYRIADEGGTTRYEAEPTGLSLPTPSRLVTFLDADSNPVGRLEPTSSSIWNWVRGYFLILGEEEEPRAEIEERWSIVDRILLRLPCFRITVGERHYVARGSRHGELFYELFFSPVEPETEETEEAVEPQERQEEEKEVEISEEEIPERLEESERVPWGDKVGEIRRPSAGASYVIEVEEASLRQAPLPLAALTILADLHLQER